MYVFPGIGLGSILCKSVHITQEMIYASAVALSKAITPSELADGRLYPELDRIRDVSVVVARVVIREAQRQGLDREPSIRGLGEELSQIRWPSVGVDLQGPSVSQHHQDVFGAARH